MRRKKNGHLKRTRKRLDTSISRQRVLKHARKAGIISNEQACEIGQWDQAWYHLNAMCEAGLLTHAGYNLWAPARKRGRSRMAV
jgi:hypothetical protein